jgi:diguanylate cyclase (GGDEF)-like protein
MGRNLAEASGVAKTRSEGETASTEADAAVGKADAGDTFTNAALAKATLQLITSEAAHKEQLGRINRWFEVALNNMARGLSMFDAEQRLIVCNKLYREIYDLPEEFTRPGTPLADIVRFHFKRETGRDSPEDHDDQRKWIAHHVAELKRGKTFTHTQHLSGGRTILVTNQPLADGSWVDLQEDITDRRQAEQKIAWLARHDALTEIPNRFHFHEQLETALQCLGPEQGLAVHWIDLDQFKDINDEFGHPIGDALLKSLGKRMHEAVRQPDFVGRLGGDEFAIVQSAVMREDQAVAFAQRILLSFGEAHQLLGQTVHIGASIGIALAPKDGNSADELLRKADIALYHAKSLGRGTYALFDPAYGYKKQMRRRLEEDLKAAVRNHELELHYQPILDGKTRQVISCEALMRWRHPQHGLIAPADFIPLAEQTGLIVEMGEWALHQACKDAATWPKHVGVTVNLSPLQFGTNDLCKTVRAALSLSGLAAHRLELEITESVLLRDDAMTITILRQLRDLGVRIALDDFGTAFASLSYLRSFPFDTIKIDRSFVRELPQRGDCAAIIEAVAGLAKRLDMRSVAEGIETAQQLDAVSEAGCDDVQGFYFSRALPAPELAEFLSQPRSDSDPGA